MSAITCIIPHYNDADRIVRAIDSCLEQDHLEEIIIVDDASLPVQAAALDQLARREKKIRLVKFAQNGGPAVARNAGAALAQTKLICFLDSDDEYLPDFFTAARDLFAAEPGIAAVKCVLEIVNEDLSPVLPETDPRLAAISFSCPGDMVLRKDAFFLIGGFPVGHEFRGPAGGEDIAFNTALVRHFDLFQLKRAYYRCYWQAGSHLARFLGRTRVMGDQWEFTGSYPDELDGTSDKRQDMFLAAVADRLEWSKTLGPYFGNKPG